MSIETINNLEVSNQRVRAGFFPVLSFKSPGHQMCMPDIETDEPFAPLTPTQSNSLRCHMKNMISSARDDLSRGINYSFGNWLE